MTRPAAGRRAYTQRNDAIQVARARVSKAEQRLIDHINRVVADNPPDPTSPYAVSCPVAPKPAPKVARRSSDAGVAGSDAQQPLMLTVRVPPSTNHLYATVRGRRVKTKEATDYAEHVGEVVWLWKQLHGEPPLPPYRLVIQLYPATRRRIDASNGIKCLEDGLFAGLKGNDRTVLEVTCRIEERDPLNPRAVVTLEHIEPAAGGEG